MTRCRRFLLSTFAFLPMLNECAWAQRLSALAPAPDWSQLESYQETITRSDFIELLDKVFAPNGAWKGVIDIHETEARIRKNLVPGDLWTLRFAAEPAATKKPPRYWRSHAELTAAQSSEHGPLHGVKIAIDPGHIGGQWAIMEERWFKLGDSLPVMEGDLSLTVGKHLANELREAGAEVILLRDKTEPVTTERPDSLREAAQAELTLRGITNPRESYRDQRDPERGQTVQFMSELLFFRTAEIRHRARMVNDQIHPDLVICLHLNAEAWADPESPAMVPRNHLHALVNGCYSAGELRNDDVRYDMLVKLLGRTHHEERNASVAVIESLAEASGLPPYTYTRDIACSVGDHPYLWARNLLANRVYQCPVVFLEPYVMNSSPVWERVQLGDYEGGRDVNGRRLPSIQREYASAVARGVLKYFSARD